MYWKHDQTKGEKITKYIKKIIYSYAIIDYNMRRIVQLSEMEHVWRWILLIVNIGIKHFFNGKLTYFLLCKSLCLLQTVVIILIIEI